MIIYEPSYASYLSEPEGCSYFDGQFFLVLFPPSGGTKTMLPPNNPTNIKCGIMQNVLAYQMEADIDGIFSTVRKLSQQV